MLAAVVALGVGAPLYVRTIEADLEQRVLAAAVELEPAVNGIAFNGQDGTVYCVTPLDYPAQLVTSLEQLRGVHSITADRTCRVLRAPTVDPNLPVPVTVATTTTTAPADRSTTTLGASTTSTTPTTTTPIPSTDGDQIMEQLASDPALTTMARIVDMSGRIVGEIGPMILLAPVDTAFDVLGADAAAALMDDATLIDEIVDRHVLDDPEGDRVTTDGDNIVIDGVARRVDVIEVGSSQIWLIDTVLLNAESGIVPIIRVDLSLDAVTISGSLDDESTLMRIEAASSAGGLPVTTAMTIEVDSAIGATQVGPFERLVRAVVTLLDTATLSIDLDGVTLDGTYRDDEAAATVTALARVLDATVVLNPRPPASAAEIDQLTDVIAELVAGDPIAFESGSARIISGSGAVLDQIAALLDRNSELDVVVRGHTDSNGVPASNLALSADRAAAVVAALVSRGVDADRLTAQGVGSAEPIVVDGVEDAERSRRVEFVLVG